MNNDLTVLLTSLDHSARALICPLYFQEDRTDGHRFLAASQRAYCRVIARIEHRYWEDKPYTAIETA